MDKVAALNLVNDFEGILSVALREDELNVWFIIDKIIAYDTSDLVLFRDCIDLLLIYKKNM